MTKRVKRFIAGAVCPQCGLQDKIVMYDEGHSSYRECVSCGFREELVTTTSTADKATAVDIQTVNIVGVSNKDV